QTKPESLCDTRARRQAEVLESVAVQQGREVIHVAVEPVVRRKEGVEHLVRVVIFVVTRDQGVERAETRTGFSLERVTDPSTEQIRLNVLPGSLAGGADLSTLVIGFEGVVDPRTGAVQVEARRISDELVLAFIRATRHVAGVVIEQYESLEAASAEYRPHTPDAVQSLPLRFARHVDELRGEEVHVSSVRPQLEHRTVERTPAVRPRHDADQPLVPVL